MTAQRTTCTLARYLKETGLELEDVYTGHKSWSDLRADAGLANEPSGAQEAVLRRACGRLLHMDDTLRIKVYRSWLESERSPDLAHLPSWERRLLRMLVGS